MQSFLPSIFEPEDELIEYSQLYSSFITWITELMITLHPIFFYWPKMYLFSDVESFAINQ